MIASKYPRESIHHFLGNVRVTDPLPCQFRLKQFESTTVPHREGKDCLPTPPPPHLHPPHLPPTSSTADNGNP